MSMSMYASSADYWNAQAEKNAKDAERYRWLRDKAYFYGGNGYPTVWCVIGTCADDMAPTHSAAMETAIDAAMAGGEAVGAA